MLVDSLKEWHDFYVLVGTAGATLLALLFVAVSLGAGYLTEEHQLATRTFMSPVVVHFTSVFFPARTCLKTKVTRRDIPIQSEQVAQL
jgi:hypothetical protein